MNDPQDKPASSAPETPAGPVCPVCPVPPSLGSRVGDFCLGFFGYLVSIILLSVLAADLLPQRPATGIVVFSLLGALGLGAVLYSIKRQRRYIAMGVVSVVAIPLLIWGTCAIFFMG